MLKITRFDCLRSYYNSSERVFAQPLVQFLSLSSPEARVNQRYLFFR